MNIRRVVHKNVIEQVIIDHVSVHGADWVTAKEIAMEIGYPWRAVARTLIYMARKHAIEQDYIEWRSSKHRMRRCAIYRYIAINTDFPAWMMPRLAMSQAAPGVINHLDKAGEIQNG
jgi:hypothetical protein